MEESQLIMGAPREEQLTAEPAGTVYKYRLYGCMGEAEDYTSLMTVLENMTEADTLILKVNGPGGSLSTCTMILEAMANCAGHIITHGQGICASAHSMILMSGHAIEIDPLALVMTHDAGGGLAGGKINESVKAMAAHTQVLENAYKRIFKPLMTPDEIKACLDGKDFWFTGEEAMQRLKDWAESQENGLHQVEFELE